MVWKSTTMMGVGKATGRNGWTYVVVSYSPRGNVQGQFGSNVLPLGTPLPAGSTPRAASVAPAAAVSVRDNINPTTEFIDPIVTHTFWN